MGKIPLDRFLVLVERSGLVERDRLADVIGEWRRQAPPGRWDDAHTCGEHLVQAGLLTTWQCQKLLEGRHRGFYLGNYKLLDHLGSGGMSNVYLAEHVLMQRRVAIKVLPQNRVADAAQLARFQFEGQAVAALDHQNIVRAYDLGSEGRIHYLVMEYVEGNDLEDLVKRSGPLDFYAAAGYIAQAAAGLEHAHDCGLVHRDIKPANLLVDRHDTIKILDMGLAKFKAEVRPVPSFANDEEVLGTADYLAPEQGINSQSVDHRADIYSLGCTLYFLLVGRPPFSGRNTGELVAAHQKQSTPDVLEVRPDAPPELAAICHKMMQKDPGERYQSAREVRDALTAWLDREGASGRIAEARPGNPASARGRHDEVARAVDADGAADVESRDSAALRHADAAVPQTAPGLPGGEKFKGPPSDVLSPASESVLSSSAGRSGPIPAPPPPPTPPVVPPPRGAEHASIPTVKPLSVRVVAARLAESLPVATSRSSGAPWRAVGPLNRSLGRAQWLMIAGLSALVIGAALLALFTFAR
jgi:serine/threonine-protein kinase